MNVNYNNFIELIKNKDVINIDKQLKTKIIKTCDYDNIAFITAAKIKDINTIKVLFKYTKKVTGVQYNYIIKEAAEHGKLNIIKFLFNDIREKSLNISEIFPSDEFAIETASKHNQIKVVNFLLNDHRTDSLIELDFALELASEFGHIEIVKLLLNDKKIKNYDGYGISLVKASKNGHINIVKILLDSNIVDCGYVGIDAILTSMKYKYTEVTLLLFENKDVKNDLKNHRIELYNELMKENIQNKVNKF